MANFQESSAVTVQKTYKGNIISVYGRASIGAAGASTIITADGASRGIVSILQDTATAVTAYDVQLDDVFVKSFVGCPDISLALNSSAANKIWTARVFSEDPVARKFKVIFYDDAGLTTTAIDAGATLIVTHQFTTNNWS